MHCIVGSSWVFNYTWRTDGNVFGVGFNKDIVLTKYNMVTILKNIIMTSECVLFPPLFSIFLKGKLSPEAFESC